MQLRATRLTAIAHAIRNLFRGASLRLDFANAGPLDPRITFSRTSNATLTGSNGLVQYAPHNLLTYSEQFDNAAWTKTDITVAANAIAAPDGSFTADLLTEGSAGTAALTRATVSLNDGATSAYSFYVKRGNTDILRCAVYSSTNQIRTWVNVATGQVLSSSAGGTGTVVSATMTAAGNGWYRVALVGSITGSATGSIQVNSATADGGGGRVPGATYYLWGAQLEIGSTATTYNPTTVKNLLGYTEHFDNAAWTKSNAFVQTNLLTYSQNLDNAAWTKSAASVTADATTAPDGSLTADKLVEAATTAEHRTFAAAITVASGTVYAFSFYAKAAERSVVAAAFTGPGVSNIIYGCYVDLNTQAVSNFGNGPDSTTVTSVGGGWYRITLTKTASAAGAVYPQLYVIQTMGTTSYAGNGTSGIYLWGAQLVQGSVAGDYQPTYAAAAAVQYAGPFGYLSAEKLVANAAAIRGYALSTLLTTTAVGQTISMYAKAAEWSRLCLGISNGTGYWSVYNFNLASGTYAMGASYGGALVDTPNMVDVGGGWYRCSVRVSATAGTGVTVLPFNQNGDPVIPSPSLTGDGTSGIYIFGAQLSDSASVDPYVYNPVAAPAAAAYYGPRFDYDPVTLAPKGLLIEEQRTNLLTYSEHFDNAAWSKIGITLTSNSTVAPDGTATAETLVEDGSTGNHWLYQSGGGAAAYSATVYAKAAGRSWLVFRFTVSGTITYAWFNVSTGALGTVEAGLTAAITPAGNGWYRCSISGTMSASSAIVIGAANANGSSIYTGNSGNALYLWGAQLEAGAFATSYIPTVASQVTRAADNVSMLGSNFSQWYNQSAGTMYSETILTTTGVDLRIAQTRDSGATVAVGLRRNVANSVSLLVRAPANFDANDGTFTTGLLKVAGGYDSSLNGVSANGGTVATTPATTVPFGVDRLIFGTDGNGFVFLNGTIKRFAYYPRRLSNSELQSITI